MHLSTALHNYTLMPLKSSPPEAFIVEKPDAAWAEKAQKMPLPVGQPVLLSACIHSVAPCELKIIDIKLGVSEDSNVKVKRQQADSGCLPLQLNIAVKRMSCQRMCNLV